MAIKLGIHKISRKLDNLSSVKIDDILVIEHGTGAISRIGTAKVMRLTKAQVICNDPWGNEQRYRIKDCLEVAAEGGKFGWVHHSRVIGVKVGG